MAVKKFATALNCIDGRVQNPVKNWIDTHCRVQFVDMVTEVGADRILIHGSFAEIAAVREKIRFSIERHNSESVTVVGHSDCQGNPISREHHFEQIRQSVGVVQSWDLWVRVIGLYFNEWNSIDVVFDSDVEFEKQTIRSFL